MTILGLAICFLPGLLYATAAGWWRKMPRLDTAFAVLVIGLMTSGWLGLVLSHVGRFSPANVVLSSAVLGVVAGAVWLGSGRVRSLGGKTVDFSLVAGRGWVWNLALALVLLAALWLYRLPGELVFGNHDAGARLDSAVKLAETGTYYLVTPTLPDATKLSLSTPKGVWSFCLYPSVTALLPDDPCRVQTPQFNGVNEIWLALGYGLLGWSRFADVLPVSSLAAIWPATPLFLYFTPFCGLMSVLALYLVGRRLLGSAVALVGAIMLAISFPQVYYSTTPMSEVPTQLMLLAAAWGLSQYNGGRDRFAAVFAGAALGIALLVRVDVAALYGLLGLWLFWSAISGHLARRHWYFLAPASLLLGHAALQYGHFASFYFWNNLDVVWQSYGGPATAFLGLVAVVATLPAIILRGPLTRRVNGLWSWLGQPRQRFWTGGVLLGLGVWQFLAWPAVSMLGQFAFLSVDGNGTSAPGRTFAMLGWYLSPWTLLAAGIGFVLLLQRGIGWLRAPLVGAGVLFAAILTMNPYVTPAHVFWVRRFVPEVLPFLLLCAAYGVVEVGRWLPIRSVPWLSAGMASFLVVNLASISLPLARSVPEYAGAIAQTQSLGRLMAPDSIVLLEATPAADWVALPLTLLYGQSTYLLPGAGKIDRSGLAQAILEWSRQGHQVYVVTELGNSTLSWRDYDFRPVGETEFLFPYLEQTYDRLPTVKRTAYTSLHVYQADPVVSKQPSFPFDIDIGSRDYGYLVSGWQESRRNEGTTYRSTGPSASLLLPWPTGQAANLTVVASGERPAGVPEAEAKVFVADQLVGTMDLRQTDKFLGYSFAVPPLVDGVVGQTTVRLEANSWRPADFGIDDARDLGVDVDSLKIEIRP